MRWGCPLSLHLSAVFIAGMEEELRTDQDFGSCAQRIVGRKGKLFQSGGGKVLMKSRSLRAKDFYLGKVEM